eukprot:jgi/Ulvmu1/3828/UM018_0040.1
MKRRPRSNPVSARIKRMMQADEDVGKIAGPTPVLISRALEVFLKDLCEGASDVAVERQARTLTPGHMKHYVLNTPHLDFLKDKFADVADLPDQPAKNKPGSSKPPAASRPAAATKPRKRQRVDEPAGLPSGAEGQHNPPATTIPSGTTFVSQSGAASQATLASGAGASGQGAAPVSLPPGETVAVTAPPHSTAAEEALGPAGTPIQGGVQPVAAQVGITPIIRSPGITAHTTVAAEDDDYDAD